MTDHILEEKIKDLEDKIKLWAEKRDLWTDSFFTTYTKEFDDEPNEVAACVLVLLSEGGMFSMFNGYGNGELLTEFYEFMENTGFYCEAYNHYIFLFYPIEEDLNQSYLEYFEWQWICELVKPGYTSLYEELFDYFSKRREKLYDLSPRKFEILLSEIFANQGYVTQLGKGQGDGGVDLRLFKKEGIDEIVTLVQAKKYKKELPIKLEAVAALSGLVHAEKANNGLFVTTSRYLNVSKKFAGRENSLIKLADSDDVSEWCKESHNLIQRDKSKLFTTEHLLELINGRNHNALEGKVVVADVGYGMIRNDFCLIIKDTQDVALLMRLPTFHNYIDSPYNTRGTEIPILNEGIISQKNKENVFRAKKHREGTTVFFSGNKHYYTLWNGNPRHFDYID